jgi:hypothetical protein
MKELISSTINPDLRKNIDMLRGDMSRSRYITKVIEQFVLESENKNFKRKMICLLTIVWRPFINRHWTLQENKTEYAK